MYSIYHKLQRVFSLLINVCEIWYIITQKNPSNFKTIQIMIASETLVYWAIISKDEVFMIIQQSKTAQ